MDPNKLNPADEAILAPGAVRCSALTRSGAPCKNLAIADGLCWMHGGRKEKSASEDGTVPVTDPLPAESASPSPPQTSGLEHTDGLVAAEVESESPVDADAASIEISDADIELISEGKAPEDLPEAEASAPADPGGLQIVWQDEPPDKETAASGAGELDILWEDELADEEAPEDGMELGIEIDEPEPAVDESEEQLQILADGELPEEEIEAAIDFDAESLGLQMADESGSATPDSELPPELSLEDREDLSDKAPAAETAPEATSADPVIDLEILDGAEIKESETPPPEEAAVEDDFGDLELELLPDDELPPEERPQGFEMAAAQRAPADGDALDDGPSASASDDADIILEMPPEAEPAPETDAADIEIVMDDDAGFDSREALAVPGNEAQPEAEDDWLGVNDINRFGAVAGQPELKDVPEFVAPESDPPAPDTYHPRQPDTGFTDAAAGYKSRTTIGKFAEFHMDAPGRREPKIIKEAKPLPKHKESFWHRRVGVPAPVFWGAAWLLLILGAISLLHYGFGIRIPHVSGLLPPRVKDAGNLKITVYGIENRFIENSHGGMLLVLSGWVRNDYTDRRRRIRVTGKLFTRGNFIQSQTVYCGDVVSDEELGDLPTETIQMRLSDHPDNPGPKAVIGPRQTLPFMIVFSYLPDDLTSLEKFTVEVTGSSQAG